MKQQNKEKVDISQKLQSLKYPINIKELNKIIKGIIECPRNIRNDITSLQQFIYLCLKYNKQDKQAFQMQNTQMFIEQIEYTVELVFIILCNFVSYQKLTISILINLSQYRFLESDLSSLVLGQIDEQFHNINDKQFVKETIIQNIDKFVEMEIDKIKNIQNIKFLNNILAFGRTVSQKDIDPIKKLSFDSMCVLIQKKIFSDEEYLFLKNVFDFLQNNLYIYCNESQFQIQICQLFELCLLEIQQNNFFANKKQKIQFISDSLSFIYKVHKSPINQNCHNYIKIKQIENIIVFADQLCVNIIDLVRISSKIQEDELISQSIIFYRLLKLIFQFMNQNQQQKDIEINYISKIKKIYQGVLEFFDKRIIFKTFHIICLKVLSLTILQSIQCSNSIYSCESLILNFQTEISIIQNIFGQNDISKEDFKFIKQINKFTKSYKLIQKQRKQNGKGNEQNFDEIELENYNFFDKINSFSTSELEIILDFFANCKFKNMNAFYISNIIREYEKLKEVASNENIKLQSNIIQFVANYYEQEQSMQNELIEQQVVNFLELISNDIALYQQKKFDLKAFIKALDNFLIVMSSRFQFQQQLYYKKILQIYIKLINCFQYEEDINLHINFFANDFDAQFKLLKICEFDSVFLSKSLIKILLDINLQEKKHMYQTDIYSNQNIQSLANYFDKFSSSNEFNDFQLTLYENIIQSNLTDFLVNSMDRTITQKYQQKEHSENLQCLFNRQIDQYTDKCYQNFQNEQITTKKESSNVIFSNCLGQENLYKNEYKVSFIKSDNKNYKKQNRMKQQFKINLKLFLKVQLSLLKITVNQKLSKQQMLIYLDNINIVKIIIIVNHFVKKDRILLLNAIQFLNSLFKVLNYYNICKERSQEYQELLFQLTKIIQIVHTCVQEKNNLDNTNFWNGNMTIIISFIKQVLEFSKDIFFQNKYIQQFFDKKEYYFKENYVNFKLCILRDIIKTIVPNGFLNSINSLYLQLQKLFRDFDLDKQQKHQLLLTHQAFQKFYNLHFYYFSDDFCYFIQQFLTERQVDKCAYQYPILSEMQQRIKNLQVKNQIQVLLNVDFFDFQSQDIFKGEYIICTQNCQTFDEILFVSIEENALLFFKVEHNQWQQNQIDFYSIIFYKDIQKITFVKYFNLLFIKIKNMDLQIQLFIREDINFNRLKKKINNILELNFFQVLPEENLFNVVYIPEENQADLDQNRLNQINVLYIDQKNNASVYFIKIQEQDELKNSNISTIEDHLKSEVILKIDLKEIENIRFVRHHYTQITFQQKKYNKLTIALQSMQTEYKLLSIIRDKIQIKNKQIKYKIVLFYLNHIFSSFCHVFQIIQSSIYSFFAYFLSFYFRYFIIFAFIIFINNQHMCFKIWIFTSFYFLKIFNKNPFKFQQYFSSMQSQWQNVCQKYTQNYI